MRSLKAASYCSHLPEKPASDSNKPAAWPARGKPSRNSLNGLQRYDGNTGRYYVNTGAPRSSAHKTVVIDECSMLTEEQLAALLDAVKGVERLILVGDPKQLPPIGAGRPYVDIVQCLKPDNIDSLFPRVGSGYAELTVTMRQETVDDAVRVDVLLANAFSGRALDAGADEDVARGCGWGNTICEVGAVESAGPIAKAIAN